MFCYCCSPSHSCLRLSAVCFDSECQGGGGFVCFCQLHSVGCQLSQSYHCAWPLSLHVKKVNICSCFSGHCWVLKLALKINAKLFFSSCNPGGQRLALLFHYCLGDVFVVFPQTGLRTCMNCPFQVRLPTSPTVGGDFVYSNKVEGWGHPRSTFHSESGTFRPR